MIVESSHYPLISHRHLLLHRPLLFHGGFYTGKPDGRPFVCGRSKSQAHDSKKERIFLTKCSRTENPESLHVKKERKMNTTFLLFVLLAAYCHNQCTRCLLVYAVNFSPANAMKHLQFVNVALNIDPAQYALMVSYGFTLLYAISSFFAGLVADRTDRVKTLCIAVVVWSCALAAQGTICSNFASLFICRVVQGFSMAFTGPQCLSLLTDYFPPASRATALAIYTSGVYLGGALGSLSIISNLRMGWRFTFVSWAVAGILISALVFTTVDDPKVKHGEDANNVAGRRDDMSSSFTIPSEAKHSKSFFATPATILREAHTRLQGGRNLLFEICHSVGRVAGPRSVKFILLATGFRFCAGYSIGCWSSPYFRARFPDQQAVFSIVNAAIIAGCGSLSAFCGGLVCDSFTRRLKRQCGDVKMLVSMLGCILAIPAWILSVRAPDFWPAMLFLALETFVAECWMGPTLAVLAEEAPPEVRRHLLSVPSAAAR